MVVAILAAPDLAVAAAAVAAVGEEAVAAVASVAASVRSLTHEYTDAPVPQVVHYPVSLAFATASSFVLNALPSAVFLHHEQSLF